MNLNKPDIDNERGCDGGGRDGGGRGPCNERGQSLIEYLILTAIIAISTMGVVRIMGHSISAKLAEVTDSIQGHRSRGRIEVERVDDRHIRKKDMSDFMNGSVNRQ